MASRNGRSARLGTILSLFIFLTSCQSEAPSEVTDAAPTSVVNQTDSLEVANHKYSWTYSSEESIASRIPSPSGYRRMPHAVGSFESWLRFLPLKPEGSPVMLHDGSEKWNQRVHVAVIDIDVGRRDLQQCADAAMRLRAEYLYQAEKFESIQFNFTSGDRIGYDKWRQGYQPSISGNDVGWKSCSTCNTSYASFRKYMDVIFMYAGTSSLSKELSAVPTSELRTGDILIYGGFPGHAVMLVDEAVNEHGEKIFLLSQSYMPAQEMHILHNPDDAELGPWYSFSNSPELVSTPEWTFDPAIFRRFGE